MQKERKKSKGNYYVAQCVITLPHSSLFSLEMTVLIPSNVMYLWENKNHLRSGAYFLGHVQPMIPLIVMPLPLFAIPKKLRTLHFVFMTWSSVSVWARKCTTIA